jgi:hypothetical protein
MVSTRRRNQGGGASCARAEDEAIRGKHKTGLSRLSHVEAVHGKEVWNYGGW